MCRLPGGTEAESGDLPSVGVPGVGDLAHTLLASDVQFLTSVSPLLQLGDRTTTDPMGRGTLGM